MRQKEAHQQQPNMGSDETCDRTQVQNGSKQEAAALTTEGKSLRYKVVKQIIFVLYTSSVVSMKENVHVESW